MALTDRQRAIVSCILEHRDSLAEWSQPWDIDRGRDLMQGGHPLKVTGERWDRHNANRLRFKAASAAY